MLEMQYVLNNIANFLLCEKLAQYPMGLLRDKLLPTRTSSGRGKQ